LTALGWFGKILGTILLVGITTGAIVGCIAAVYVDRYINTDLDINLEDFQLDLTSYVYYYNKSTGEYEILEELYSSENRVWADYDEIPEYLLHALVAIEDKRFYSHNGVDWYRTAGAFANMFLGIKKGSFGGSTITQQLIKNVTGEKEVTVRRKLTEIFRAVEFEKGYSNKDDILVQYLNLVYFGQGCYGVQSAAKTYFGKDVSELTLAESAAIVGITNLPTYYDPYINRDNNKKRQEYILNEMFDQGYISASERDAAIDQKLVFNRDSSQQTSSSTSIQSYFTDQVIRDAITDLSAAKGIDRSVASQLIYRGGYRIYTTLDSEIQAIIDEVYTNPDYWPALKATAETAGEDPQSAIVVMDPYTGNIVGMYGGLGEKTANLTHNRATMSTRQPGSSIKPLAVYAPAIESGLITPYSVYTDMPVQIEGGNPWPKNYDSRTYGFRGQMTVMEAVQRSINTIAAKIVLDMSPQYSYEFARYSMGLSTLVDGVTINGKVYSDASVSPMSLGGLTKGVTVRDMCAAYSIFTNEGVYNSSKTYTRIEDSNGNLVLDNSPDPLPVIKSETAYYMNLLLQNVVTNGTGVNARLSGMPSAGKTGTTNDDYDRWYVGYTPYYTCAVWYGFDVNRTIVTADGTSPAVPLYKAVMSKIHENLESKDFFTPNNKPVKASYCIDSGGAPTEACRNDIRGSRVATGTFFEKDIPSAPCTLHQYVDVDSESGLLATPYCPPENIVRVSMLRLDRYFPKSIIPLNDEQYTIRLFDIDYTAETEIGYRVSAPANKDGSPPKNSFCPLHSDPDWNIGLPTEPIEPTDPFPPASPLPGDPDNPALPPEDITSPIPEVTPENPAE
jgi:penicillin-binding protein 1A